MGESVNGESKQLIQEVGGATTGNSTGSKSSENTGATTGAGGRGDRGDRGDRGATATGKEKEPTKLSVLTEEEKRAERNRKRRERYAKQKAEQGDTPKPKKVKKKKADENALGTEQLNALIKSVSVMIASRPKCEHWLMSDKEIESITTPLSNILKDSEAFKNIGEHSNQIALVFACITVILPRAIKSISMMQEEKKNERRVKQQSKSDENKVTKLNRENSGRPASNGEDSRDNEPWYGSALY